MFKLTKLAFLGAVLAAGMVAQASAADLYIPPEEPPVYDVPPPATGGWYLRGDVDYHFLTFRGGDYITYGCPVGSPGCVTPGPTPGTNSFDTGKLRSSFSLGAGVGYQVNRYFRTDLTADYMFDSKFTGTTSGTGCGTGPCSSTDESKFSALLLLANAYAELGTYNRITPYIGAGIGGARVKWDSLGNTITGSTSTHAGATNWRFAWALMAGASYCINDNWKVDLGYRYARISGGRMFQETTPAGVSIGVGPGDDRGIDIHEARLGLRYAIGGGNQCVKPNVVAYEPPPPAVYK